MGISKSLIDIFEESENQTVEQFNKVFKATKLLGYDDSEIVSIGELCAGNERVITIRGNTFRLNLEQKTTKPERKKKAVVNVANKPRKVEEKRKLSLSDIYKTLKPTEFMLYSAIKEVGQVDGMEEFSRAVRISNKTIALNIKRLVELNLIKIEEVASTSGNFNRITLTQHNT